ncbi:MAG: hypothetical protein AB7N76_13580 [Planctomycetota bacterium]
MNKITVKVEYVGQADFEDEVPAGQVLQAIKVRAMKFFGIEPGAEGKYELLFEGSAQSDQTHVGDFGRFVVVLTLALREEVAKG